MNKEIREELKQYGEFNAERLLKSFLIPEGYNKEARFSGWDVYYNKWWRERNFLLYHIGFLRWWIKRILAGGDPGKNQHFSILKNATREKYKNIIIEICELIDESLETNIVKTKIKLFNGNEVEIELTQREYNKLKIAEGKSNE